MSAVGWILLALAAFLAVLCVNALRFRPLRETAAAPLRPEVDGEAAARALSALVQCPTVSHPDREGDDPAAFDRLTALLKTLFPRVHAACTCQVVGDRALLYRWKGLSDAAPLLLTAHYDVVPADAAEWSFDPFGGERRDGMVRGRGTLDTKGTLTAILSAAETLLAGGYTPARDVYFGFAGDEEVMGGSAGRIAEALQARGVRPLCVVDEGGAIVTRVFPGVQTPCALVGVAEKGSVNYRLQVTAKGGHSSAPLRNTPVDLLARACVAIWRKPFPFRVTPPARQLIDGLARHSTFAYRLVFANLGVFKPLLNMLCRRTGGELNALFRTTTAFTVLRAGEAVNVLPTGAEMRLNARVLPGETIEGTLVALRRRVRDPRVEVSLLKGLAPSACSATDGEGYAALRRAVQQVYPGVLISPYLMIACSDARHYEGLCGHVFRFSGMPLSAEERRMIHGVDERISESTLADTVRFFLRLMVNVCGEEHA